MYIKLMKNKKGQVTLAFIILLVIGFILSLLIDSIILIYIIIVLSGFGLGAFLCYKKEEMKSHYIIASIGFIAGYILGVKFTIRLKLIIVFILSIILGYFIYKNFLVPKNKK